MNVDSFEMILKINANARKIYLQYHFSIRS